MFFKKQFIVLLSFLVLTACMNTKIDFEKKLASAPACCNDLAGVSYKSLVYDKAVVSRVGDDKSLARQFKEGKSYFVPFQLLLC